jgi:hypothetical protein
MKPDGQPAALCITMLFSIAAGLALSIGLIPSEK